MIAYDVLIITTVSDLQYDVGQERGQISGIDTPHLTQDTNGKVTTSQLDITNESQEVSHN